MAWSQGVDLSQFNSVYDWTRVWTSLDFVVHRTTIGQYTLDAMFDARLEHLRGRLWGAYHVLTPGADPAAQAKAVMTLLENPDRALRMARHARRVAVRYTWPHVREAWARAYAGQVT